MSSGWMKGRVEYIHRFALEQWYDTPGLQEATARTVFVPLAAHQVKSLYQHACYAQKYGVEPSDEDRETFRQLEEETDNIINSEFGGDAFIKLSTRSPKDAAAELGNERMVHELQETLKESDGTDNGDTVAFCTAMRRALKVQSGPEALELLCNSSRVREDIMRVKDCGEFGAFPLALVVREWIGMHPKEEFRVFVKNRNITAISQYCYYQYFPSVVEKKKEIQDCILSFWDSTRDIWEEENLVLDLLVVPEDDHVSIIEVNPYFGDTGGCLFEWRGRDKEVLSGNAPLEFRVLEAPCGDPLSCLPREWVEYIDTFRGKDPEARYARREIQSVPAPGPSGAVQCEWCVCY